MSALARKAYDSVVQFFSADSRRTAATESAEHKVGEYVADYSEVSIDQIMAPHPELDELFKSSKVVSVKREL